MTTNDTEARGVREDAERIREELAKLIKGIEFTCECDLTAEFNTLHEFIMIILRRDREERARIPSIDYVKGCIDARKDIDTLGAKADAWLCRKCGKGDWADIDEQLAKPEHVCHRGIDLGECKGEMVPLYRKHGASSLGAKLERLGEMHNQVELTDCDDDNQWACVVTDDDGHGAWFYGNTPDDAVDKALKEDDENGVVALPRKRKVLFEGATDPLGAKLVKLGDEIGPAGEGSVLYYSFGCWYAGDSDDWEGHTPREAVDKALKEMGDGK